jgi:signal transduction histidine kinase
MKLATKIVLIFLLGIVPLTLVHGYVIVVREDLRLKKEIEREVQSLGRSLEETLTVKWLHQGHEEVARFVQLIDRQHQHFRVCWVSMDFQYGASSPEITLEQLQGTTAGQILSMTLPGEAGERRYLMYYPVHAGDHRAGYLEFSESLADVRAYTRTTIIQTAAVMGAMVLCGVLVALMGMRLVGRPLNQLIEKTERIGQGDFSEPLQLNSNDELGQLADALNRMSEQLHEQQEKIRTEAAGREAALEQLRHVDRLKTVGRLASGVAHELGTPLNVVSGRAALIASGNLDSTQVPESARIIKSEADRMATIIRQLLDFARRRSPQSLAVDLGHIAGQCVQLLQTLATKQNVKLDLAEKGEAVVANVDAAQIQQVLTNLIVNAIQAMPEGGVVTVSLGKTTAHRPDDQTGASTDCYFISVADQGQGIRSEEQQHIFEPFFTTKHTGEGTGLGLSVSYGIVQDHGGWIEVESELGKGSQFTVYLPREA